MPCDKHEREVLENFFNYIKSTAAMPLEKPISRCLLFKLGHARLVLVYSPPCDTMTNYGNYDNKVR